MKTAKMPVQSFSPDPARLGPLALDGQAEPPQTFTLVQVEVSPNDKTTGLVGAETATVTAPSADVAVLVEALNQSGKQTIVVLEFEHKNDKKIVKKLRVEQRARNIRPAASVLEEPVEEARAG
jgi:hypothetical protein